MRARAVSTFLVVFVLASCSDEPKLVVHPGTLAIGPSSFSFGSVFVGDRATKEIEIRTADEPVFLAVEASGLSTRFSVSPFVVDLPAGSIGTVEIAFAPTETGFAAGEIELRSQAGTAAVIRFDGVGIVRSTDTLRVDGDLEFGDVRVGHAATLPLVFQSESHETIEVEIEGNSEAFSVDVDRFTLEPGERRILSVTFLPVSRGAESSTFRIESCPECPEKEVVATGRGVATALRALPERVEFGQVSALVREPRRRSVTIENVGDFEVALDDVFTMGEGFAIREDDDALPRLGIGGTTEVEVSFLPFARGTSEGLLYVVDLEGDTLLEVPLRGKMGGPELRANPSSINFGYRTVGGPPASVDLAIENIGDPAEVTVLRTEIVGTGATSYQAMRLGSARIDPAVNLSVSYASASAGSHSAELVVYTDFEDQPELRVPLSGTARETPGEGCQFFIFGQYQVAEDGTALNPPDSGRYVFNNVGRFPCIVWDFRLTDPVNFSIVSAPQGTTTVLPGDWIDVVYGFQMPPGHFALGKVLFETQFGTYEVAISGSR